MNFQNAIVLLAIGSFDAVAIWAGARFFSPDAKLERRRRRNNYRVASKGKQPAIKFSVRTKKD